MMYRLILITFIVSSAAGTPQHEKDVKEAATCQHEGCAGGEDAFSVLQTMAHVHHRKEELELVPQLAQGGPAPDASTEEVGPQEGPAPDAPTQEDVPQEGPAPDAPTEETPHSAPEASTGASPEQPAPSKGQDAESKETPCSYAKCTYRGPLCDLRLNGRDELNIEGGWALQFLKTMPENFYRAFEQYGQLLHDHIKNANEERGLSKKDECPNVQTFTQYAQSLKTGKSAGMEDLTEWVGRLWKQAKPDSKSGRRVANWVGAKFVNLRDASGVMADAPAAGCLEKQPNICNRCAWKVGEAGLGTDSENLKNYIGAKNNEAQIPNRYMWEGEKGRGTPQDKAAMVNEVARDVVTDAMGTTFEDQLKQNGGEKNWYREMPLAMKQSLPNAIKWQQTKENPDFGIWSYGGKPPEIEKESKDFFFQAITKGMGIHGRNLIKGSQADRMTDVGMPWIGGASGSLTEIYILAKNLGMKGKELEDLCLAEVAVLVAIGAHSLGEALLAGWSMFMYGGGENSRDEGFEDNAAVHKASSHFFSGKSARKLVEIMNAPVETWEKAKASQNLPALYQAAISEFIAGTHTEGYTEPKCLKETMRTSLTASTRLLKDANWGNPDELKTCLKMPGIHMFTVAVADAGGPQRAFESWSLTGLSAAKTGLTAAEFVTLIAQSRFTPVIVEAEASFHLIVGCPYKVGTGTACTGQVTEAELAKFTQGGQAEPEIAKLVHVIEPALVKAIKDSGKESLDQSAYTLAYLDAINKMLSDLHECAARETSSGPWFKQWKTKVVTEAAFSALYYDAALHQSRMFSLR